MIGDEKLAPLRVLNQTSYSSKKLKKVLKHLLLRGLNQMNIVLKGMI
jgi:hypothetical protein